MNLENFCLIFSFMASSRGPRDTMLIAQHSSTSSKKKKWRIFGWKNLTCCLITPCLKSQFSQVSVYCWMQCGNIDADHNHISEEVKCKKDEDNVVRDICHQFTDAVLSCMVALAPSCSLSWSSKERCGEEPTWAATKLCFWSGCHILIFHHLKPHTDVANLRSIFETL